MIRPLFLAIGFRYLRAKRRTRFISFISAASMLGIAIGVTALITVISVMNGFEQELRARILGMVAHATIAAPNGSMSDWQSAVDIARKDPRVTGAAPFVDREAMLQAGNAQGVLLRGIDPALEPGVSELGDAMVVGQLDDLQPGDFHMLIGAELALVLGVDMGDKVAVYVPEFRASPIGALPQMKRFTVAGIFEAGMQEYDLQLAVIHIADAQKLMRLGADVSGVRLRLDDMFRARAVARDIGDQLASMHRVRDWTSDHGNFFRAIALEKTVMFLILSLIIAVAAFNLVSSLVMLVNDKQADIAILRTLGLTPGGVMRIFMVQGLTIGLIGIVLGVVGGVLLTLNLHVVVGALENVLGFELMPADIYYISGGVPTDLRAEEIGWIAAVAVVLCSLATIYPAWRAARTDPATALRYE